jgi:chromosomal replication initiation ATPase DnaA
MADGMAAKQEAFGQMRLPLAREGAAEGLPLVVSDCNRAAAERLAAWPRAGLAPVLALHGPAGCGKSRLATAWAERVGALPLHGVEATLVDPLELEGRPVLLDDAEEADEESLFHLFNLAQSGGGALLIVARSAPASWAVALPDLRSRLASALSVAVEAPDDAVLAAILKSRFAERSISPPDEVIAYLVRRIDRSAEAAEEVVERLDATHRPVRLALAREVV